LKGQGHPISGDIAKNNGIKLQTNTIETKKPKRTWKGKTEEIKTDWIRDKVEKTARFFFKFTSI